MELWTKTSQQFSTNSEGEYRLIYLFWEKQWQKAFFDKRPGRILCDAERGEKSAQREIWEFYAHMAHPCVPLHKVLLTWFRKYHKRYFPHNKKDPCNRVRIGFTFALLIWLCLKQWSLLESPLRSGSYRVRPCTIDLIVFEARKRWLRDSDCTGDAWGSDSVNYLHFRYPCRNALNQSNLRIL